MAAERSRFLPVALFGTLAIVAAFVVSAIAGMGDQAGDGGAGAVRAANRGAPREPDTPAYAEIRVEVLNGAGGSGLARDVTHRLREGGFDVVYFGNAARFDYPRSVVLDRMGDPARGRAVAAALGIDTTATAVDPSLLLDVTVILGGDWPLPVPGRKRWPDRAREWLARDTLD
jgi:hypothetical protein